MALPVVNLITGKVSWTPGAAVQGADVTGFIVGLRSLNAVGSAVGTYPILSPAVSATATQDALAAITSTLKADNYAASVQAQSGNGASVWATEYQFQGVLPVPLAPTGVSVS